METGSLQKVCRRILEEWPWLRADGVDRAPAEVTDDGDDAAMITYGAGPSIAYGLAASALERLAELREVHEVDGDEDSRHYFHWRHIGGR